MVTSGPIVTVLSIQMCRGGSGACIFFFGLFSTRYVMYFTKLWFLYFMKCLSVLFGMRSLLSFLMGCLCMTPLTLVVMVMSGFTFQLLFWSIATSGLYLLFCEFVMATCKFYKLECDRWGGGDGEGTLVGASYYA